ncbi:A24 family peptidase [Mesobacillus harenae]|uniref:A24 family peptidase n=1 Tax=Mesobacillus harenae TaxID=2213203 RepID=UPI0015808637|nr:A24 family peptidase [Mesobacillus harenae]
MWINLFLIILLTTCVITDWRERKIYNKVLFPFLVIALAYHIITGGWIGLADTLTGTVVGFSILLIPYFMGGMGAGDVKLLAVIGALKGTGFVLMTALYMGIIGGIIGILVLLFRSGAKARLLHFAFMFIGVKHGVKFPFTMDKEALKTTYPYGIAIAAGAIIAISVTPGGFFS